MLMQVNKNKLDSKTPLLNWRLFDFMPLCHVSKGSLLQTLHGLFVPGDLLSAGPHRWRKKSQVTPDASQEVPVDVLSLHKREFELVPEDRCVAPTRRVTESFQRGPVDPREAKRDNTQGCGSRAAVVGAPDNCKPFDSSVTGLSEPQRSPGETQDKHEDPCTFSAKHSTRKLPISNLRHKNEEPGKKGHKNTENPDDHSQNDATERWASFSNVKESETHKNEVSKDNENANEASAAVTNGFVCEGSNQSSGTSDGDAQIGANAEGSQSASSSGYDCRYVEFYKRLRSQIRRSSLMLVGHIKAGKSCLVDSLLQRPYRETESTNGLELAICDISKTFIDGTWQERRRSFWERVNELEQSLSELLATEGINPRSNEQLDRNIWDSEKLSDMTLIDSSGEFCFYKTHQMFLCPNHIFLLVMNTGVGLDETLPESCATKAQTGKIECPRTPRQFLDYWMNTICTYSQDATKDQEELEPHVIIVLTHTDKFESDNRKEQLAKRKEEVLAYVTETYACRFVYHEVFGLSNKERTEDDLRELDKLRSTIVKLSKAKPLYNSKQTCLWLKFEADLYRLCHLDGRKCFSVSELQTQVADPLGMEEEELRSGWISTLSVAR